jgi:hypothetical protein
MSSSCSNTVMPLPSPWSWFPQMFTIVHTTNVLTHHEHQGRVYHVWAHFWDLVCNVDVRMVCLATCEISFVHLQFARLLYLFPSTTMYFVGLGISYSHASTERFRRASLSFSFLRVLDDPHISCISCISCINSINCIPMIPSKVRLVRLVPSRCV